MPSAKVTPFVNPHGVVLLGSFTQEVSNLVCGDGEIASRERARVLEDALSFLRVASVVEEHAVRGAGAYVVFDPHGARDGVGTFTEFLVTAE